MYDNRTKNPPIGETLKERKCVNECTRKEVMVHLAKNLETDTCSGESPGGIKLPPTLKVYIVKRSLNLYHPFPTFRGINYISYV